MVSSLCYQARESECLQEATSSGPYTKRKVTKRPLLVLNMPSEGRLAWVGRSGEGPSLPGENWLPRKAGRQHFPDVLFCLVERAGWSWLVRGEATLPSPRRVQPPPCPALPTLCAAPPRLAFPCSTPPPQRPASSSELSVSAILVGLGGFSFLFAFLRPLRMLNNFYVFIGRLLFYEMSKSFAHFQVGCFVVVKLVALFCFFF